MKLNKGRRTNYRSIDVRKRIEETFGDDISFSKMEGSKSLYVHSADKLPQISVDDVYKSAMSKSVILKRAARIVHDSIMDSCAEQKWPPTPQEILQSGSDTNQDLLNLISWIVHPRGQLDNNGNVTVPESKKGKIFHLANDIECLLPGVLPSLEQILFSATLHARSGSKDAVDTAHSFGYGFRF